MTHDEAFDLVLAAATRRLTDLVNEQYKYEKLKMPSIVEEYERYYTGPLRTAIKIVKEESQ